ncbi:hypothetical protein KA005_07600 [bacterium]|nr:hypothetical protein [bacterium]
MIITHAMNTTWGKKREAFFAMNPKCTECGGAIDHYTRTGLCRKCQVLEYRRRAQVKAPEYRRQYVKKHKERIRAYQARYYLINREAISQQKKDRYHERKQLTASYI